MQQLEAGVEVEPHHSQVHVYLVQAVKILVKLVGMPKDTAVEAAAALDYQTAVTVQADMRVYPGICIGILH